MDSYSSFCSELHVHAGEDSEGVRRRVSVESPFDSKFHFHWKRLLNFINSGYGIYPEYSHLLLFTFS